ETDEALSQLDITLRSRLPDYMVPAHFVSLDYVPLTPNGKLDRRALPSPDAGLAVVTSGLRGRTEATLGAMWAAMLELEAVDRETNFFALGGHSLLATQVIARIADDFGVDIPLQALFGAPTIAGLAALIDAEQAERLPPLKPLPLGAEHVLSFSQ